MQNKNIKEVLIDFPAQVCPHCSNALDIQSEDPNGKFIHQFFTASHYHTYLSKKQRAIFYRIIFFGFSLLFGVLGAIIYFKTMNGISQLYFPNSELIKTLIMSLCGFLSLGAFAIACSINPKREAFHALVHQMDSSMWHNLFNHSSENAFIVQNEEETNDNDVRSAFSCQQLYTHTLKNLNKQTQKIVQLLERQRTL